MTFINSFDGCKIYYEYTKGRKPCLVFLHGISGNCTVWKHQAEFFKENGYGVLAMDLCGHGRSHKDNHKQRYSLENLAKDVEAIIKKEEIGVFVLVGHSMGGMIALAYDRLYPGKAKGLVLIATPAVNPLRYQVVPHVDLLTPVFKAGASAAAWIACHIRRSSYPYIDYSTLGSLNAITVLFHDLRCTPTNAYFWMSNAMFGFDIRQHLPKIKQPVLLVTGDNDRALSKQALLDIKQLVPHARLEVMRRTDHLNPIRKPLELSRLILKFIEGVK